MHINITCVAVCCSNTVHVIFNDMYINISHYCHICEMYAVHVTTKYRTINLAAIFMGYIYVHMSVLSLYNDIFIYFVAAECSCVHINIAHKYRR